MKVKKDLAIYRLDDGKEKLKSAKILFESEAVHGTETVELYPGM